MFEYLAGLGWRKVALWTGILTVIVEALTCLLRFGLGLEAQKQTWEASLTFGFRVHHGFVGLALLVVAAVLRGKPGIRNLLVISGGALFLSDLVHHFLVLWPVTGYHDFYLWYDQAPPD
ncbi:MAG: hypothetical protein JW909_01765 [Planctomycetes bacterium]|nr:hypothetical protein [Planctomycetota bacterium]